MIARFPVLSGHNRGDFVFSLKNDNYFIMISRKSTEYILITFVSK